MITPEQYSEDLYQADETLLKVKESIAAAGIQDVSIAPGYGRLLTMLVQMSRAENVLEIGALGGYSGICLARGLAPGGRIVSLELSQENADLAHRNMHEAGFGDQAVYMTGPALDSLKALQAKGDKFDFFFIDADKENYPNYLEYAIQLGRPGAIIAGDNTLLRGRTLNTEKNGPSVLAMRKFNETIARDERLISTFLPAYDGLALAMVK
ncbi:O-methyltransferase [Paenibacillus sp. YPG26]|uniref:O-methyltransferase n=1 Tax=Paenibacillus sp. YPG26 TaxID=2878915 RepID=UPI00203A5880|nr:O-methyltransferase [Paenibacillus sp. YPG26]USB32265.1 O-methyltransferase [Paenibacillus sp. YPG26]